MKQLLSLHDSWSELLTLIVSDFDVALTSLDNLTTTEVNRADNVLFLDGEEDSKRLYSSGMSI